MLTRRHFITALGTTLGGGAAIGATSWTNAALPAPTTDTEIAQLYAELREVRQAWKRDVAPTLPVWERDMLGEPRPWDPIVNAIVTTDAETAADVLRKKAVLGNVNGNLEFRNEAALRAGREMTSFIGGWFY